MSQKARQSVIALPATQRIIAMVVVQQPLLFLKGPLHFRFLLISITMILSTTRVVPTANALRVAVLGSGIAGATAARTLADRGIEVTVFEAGFGIGGRTSTRQTRDAFRFQFDHGAQYIGKPKTSIFQEELDKWKSHGWVKEWKGRFGVMTDGRVTEEEEAKERYVGVPGMHSICRNLLHHKNIRVQLQTRANAVSSSHNTNGEDEEEETHANWQLIHGKTKKDLGMFDWLIVSDRMSGMHYRKDLASAGDEVKEQFRSSIRGVKSVKCLTAMVVFESSLNSINVDGLQFTGNDPKYGALGWVARDSSKPGRERSDNRECWVLQSHPDAAAALLKGKKLTTQQIRDLTKEVLVRDFLNCLPLLAAGEDGQTTTATDVPPPVVATAIGHRWGAAFPIPSQGCMDTESQLIPSKKFISCGDYFGKLPGRIEGAYLSGISAANQLCDTI